ncbi:hypothetical protein EDEG_00352 [Edhazardia aedis USNM 41457]|uniref:Helicase C-terminal domain-containing protein n=1 Tax=Edhazardia aedis (strain USNM 41457) TaxID=1003232 RepID=J9D1P3_EDHAE|nr:hypothetical protein EDEG_00352 [Edhazardia aedis USNM 41457]|eukprot:EJW01761.1 hypothetical protein EDEG_00352 [Edhazardia aedis USNM 41457]
MIQNGNIREKLDEYNILTLNKINYPQSLKSVNYEFKNKISINETEIMEYLNLESINHTNKKNLHDNECECPFCLTCAQLSVDANNKNPNDSLIDVKNDTIKFDNIYNPESLPSSFRINTENDISKNEIINRKSILPLSKQFNIKNDHADPDFYMNSNTKSNDKNINEETIKEINKSLYLQKKSPNESRTKKISSHDDISNFNDDSNYININITTKNTFKQNYQSTNEPLFIKKQILLFSATFPTEIKFFVQEYMNNPRELNLMPELALKSVAQFYVKVPYEKKLHCLKTILKKLNINKCVVFCNSLHTVEQLGERIIEMGFPTYYFHGQMTKEERKAVFNDFIKKEKEEHTARIIPFCYIVLNTREIFVGYVKTSIKILIKFILGATALKQLIPIEIILSLKTILIPDQI